MFGSIKTWITVALLAVMAGGAWFAWNYYKTTQAEIKILTANNAQLELVVETNNKTLEELQKQFEEQRIRVEELNTALAESEEHLKTLEALLARHNLQNLAFNKPGLIEKRINDATNEIFRAIECDTGNCVR